MTCAEPTGHTHHVVTFYQSDDFITARVAAFVAEGCARGEDVLLLATPARWNAVAAQLDAQGVAYRDAQREDRLRIVPARRSGQRRAAFSPLAASRCALVRAPHA